MAVTIITHWLAFLAGLLLMAMFSAHRPDRET